jgi:hypothetical protein
MIGPALEFPRKVSWLEGAGDGCENDAHHSSQSVITIVIIKVVIFLKDSLRWHHFIENRSSKYLRGEQENVHLYYCCSSFHYPFCGLLL